MQGDAVRVIEAVYELEGTSEMWLRQVCAAAAALESCRNHIIAVIWAVDGTSVRIQHVNAARSTLELVRVLRRKPGEVDDAC